MLSKLLSLCVIFVELFSVFLFWRIKKSSELKVTNFHIVEMSFCPLPADADICSLGFVIDEKVNHENQEA